MQYVATVGLSLILLVLFANLLVDLYARGAVRDALDEGVRAAAPAGSGRARVRGTGTRGRGRLVARRARTTTCASRAKPTAPTMVAHAEGTLPSWLPFVVPPWRLSLTATMQGES